MTQHKKSKRNGNRSHNGDAYCRSTGGRKTMLAMEQRSIRNADRNLTRNWDLEWEDELN